MKCCIYQVKIAFPSTLLPSPTTGALGSSTQLLTSPKNNKAFFDVAFSGPLLGGIASLGTLVYGLQQTLQVRSNEIAALPHVPLDFLKLSSLTSATIESLMGTDVLLSIDPPSDNVAVHPMVIAGHVGILVNALALLPTRYTSDGGRMLRGAFSRFSVAVRAAQPLFVLFLVVQAFRDWETSSMLALYLFIGGACDDNVDVPCRNDVDPAGGLRIALFVASALVAAIAVSPAF